MRFFERFRSSEAKSATSEARLTPSEVQSTSTEEQSSTPEAQSSAPVTDWDSLKTAVPFNRERAEQARQDKVDAVEQVRESEIEAEKLENFNKFVNFVDKDTSVKKALSDLAPSDKDLYGDGAVAYADRLYEGFRDIKDDLSSIMQDYYRSDILEKRLDQIETDLVNAGANAQRLQSVYQRDFASMSENFSDQAHKAVTVHPTMQRPHTLDKTAESVNEMLHLMHLSIVNNEYRFKNLPILDSGDNKKGKKVNLYGTPQSRNPVAEGIFDRLKDGNDGITDIVSLKDRTLMMVRDRGHALTLDITEDADGKTYVDYFIPKICNVDKVNALPGVRKVPKVEGQNQVREFTTGVFSAESNVPDAVADFISRVPTDADIEV